MRIRQYAYFGIRSQTLTPADITGRLGVEPDEVRIMGSRKGRLPASRHHFWRVVSKRPGLTVAEHLDALLDRLGPFAGAIGDLAEEIILASPESVHLGSVLQVVRFFDDEDGEEEELSVVDLPDGTELTKLSGQHQLLGWRLAPNVIDFLSTTRAVLDVDEYG